MFLILELFYWVVVDIVGLLELRMIKGNKYILMIIDFVICYFEVVVLFGIEIEWVVEVLVDVFSCVGVFREILID